MRFFEQLNIISVKVHTEHVFAFVLRNQHHKILVITVGSRFMACSILIDALYFAAEKFRQDLRRNG